ncbi:MAG TPA: TonB-dependent receptor [Terriglobales bacterium]|nr:TonB-dependent receptor [Terriglobales bacterium]
MRRVNVLSQGLLIIWLCSLPSFAQMASIAGTVTDSTGAVVPEADVTARSLESNAARSVTTSPTGTYSLPDLPVGTYYVTVKKASFASHVAEVRLSVAEMLDLNVQLQPGVSSEQIDVRADEAADIDLETAQLSNLVDHRKIADLPLITRDPYSLVLLSPGTFQTDSSNAGFSVNGARDRNNNFLLDGVDNNDTSVPGAATGGVLSANPDSTQEFRVITDNFNAEFGRNNGAIIDVVTRSGTNSFHGDLYEFGRWNGFGGARDWFNPASQGRMNPYVRNQFGGSIGGPIIKNKTFFFFNEEVHRFRTALTAEDTVPTPAFKTGLFNFNGTQAINLLPGSTQNLNNLPMDPTMQKVFALYPNPTVPSGDGFTGLYFFPSESRNNVSDSVIKIDHHLTDRESLSVRYGYDHQYDPNSIPTVAILPGDIGGIAEKAITQGLGVQLTSILRDTLINNFQFGWNHIYARFLCSGLGVLDSPGGVDQFGSGRDYVMDPFTSFGCASNGLLANDQFRKTGTVSYTESLSWVHGSHTFKFGFDFRNVGENGAVNFNSRRQLMLDPDSFFGTNFYSPINVPNSTQALDDAASAFYGLVASDLNAGFFNKTGVRQPTNGRSFRQHEFDWYGQDTWKVRPNLTLNFGVRYQLNGVPYEENANFSNLLRDPSSFATGQPVVFTIVGPGTGKSMYNPDYSDVEPRVGLSWDPWSNGKTAIRAAFGIFHDRIFGNIFENARGNPPFENDYNTFPLNSINQALPIGNDYSGLGGPCPACVGAVPSVLPNSSFTFSAAVPDGTGLTTAVPLDVHLRNPTSNNWNLGIQRTLTETNILYVTYVGTMGVHILGQRDGNPPVPALVQQLVAYCSNPNNAYACTPDEVSGFNLYEGFNYFGVLPFNAVSNNALIQPSYEQTGYNSIYHGLQTKFIHRLNHGVQVEGAYTWSHAIDNSVDPLSPAVGARTFPRNSRDLAESRGNSDNDTRHVGVINYVWEVPLGRGRAYANQGVLGKVLEGMQFSGITTLQTGHPWQVRTSVDSQRTGIEAWGLQVGDPFAGPASTACAASSGLGRIYVTNSCAFVVPPFGSPGSARNSIYGPGFVDFDLAFSKKMKLSERFQLETRFEGYNIFNHPHFLNPGTDSAGVGNLVGSSLFGIITSTYTQPDGTTSARQIQVAMKLSF